MKNSRLSFLRRPLFWIGLVIVLALFAGGAYFYFNQPNARAQQTAIVARGDGFERETEFLYFVPANTIAFQDGLPLTIEQEASAPNQTAASSIGAEVKRAGNFALAAEIRDPNDKVVRTSFTPITLEAGQQRIPFSLRVPDPAASYNLQLTLYDSAWAALPSVSLQANVKFTQQK